MSQNKSLPIDFINKSAKLLSCQKERIYNMFHNEGYTMYRLKKMFNVDARIIRNICYPELAEKEKEKRKKVPYNIKHKEAMQRYRAHLKELKNAIKV